MFTINYNTGVGNTSHSTIAEALAAVDPAYTQCSITLDDAEGNALYKMPWWGVEYDEETDDEPPFADFGKFGYFGQWVSL